MEKNTLKKIQEKIKSKEVFIGLNSTMRAFRDGKLSMVVYASNVSEDMLKVVNSMDIEKVDYPGDSEALSIACGKSFNITVLGIKK